MRWSYQETYIRQNRLLTSTTRFEAFILLTCHIHSCCYTKSFWLLEHSQDKVRCYYAYSYLFTGITLYDYKQLNLDPLCLGRSSYWFDILLGNAIAISGEVRPTAVTPPTIHDLIVSRRVTITSSTSFPAYLFSCKHETLLILVDRETPEKAMEDEIHARVIVMRSFMVIVAPSAQLCLSLSSNCLYVCKYRTHTSRLSQCTVICHFKGLHGF